MILLNKQEEIIPEYHEHPFFNGQYHQAVWMKTWASTGTTEDVPDDAYISCEICGKSYAN